PPDHRYVCFGRADFQPQASDLCNEPVTWRFAGCASDQPDDADGRGRRKPKGPWHGDGNTEQDCVVEPGGESICVRAERAGTGPGASSGRRYRVSIVAADA